MKKYRVFAVLEDGTTATVDSFDTEREARIDSEVKNGKKKQGIDDEDYAHVFSNIVTYKHSREEDFIENIRIREGNQVYVITVSTDYEIEQQCVFTSQERADIKYEELCREHFESWFLESRDLFDAEDTFMEYQGSEAWWEDDNRTRIFLKEQTLDI